MTLGTDAAARPGGREVPWEWTRGPGHVTPDATVWDLVVAQAARTPQAPAVRQWDERLSYRVLIDAAAALGARLRALGVGPESRVGICARRSALLPVGVLGVLASGGAYVPLDPAHPRRRLAGIVADAGIGVLVVDETGRSLLPDTDCTVIDLIADARAGNPAPCPVTPQHAAYVLFTSGSTGRPKGVAVSHRSMCSFVTATAEHFQLGADCRSIAFSALGFDVSVLDMLTPLTVGGSVELIPDDDRTDPARLQRFLEAHEVTWGFVPPALLPLLEPDRLPSLRDMVTAGEPPGPEQVARWSAPPRRRLHNWYGPTEATVCTVGGELTGVWQRPVPIGRPLAGCRAYVLDERLRPCPPGTPGELYLGGPQVARGYLGQPALTAQRFVPDPFVHEPGDRLFRTGDGAAWNADGTIQLLGRLDRQVKIQGQRVEVGEVETVLLGHPRVTQAAVDVIGSNGYGSGGSGGSGGELVAFLAPSGAPDLGELRKHCAERLPTYMMPTRVHRLDALPLTPSGKTDLATLAALAPDAAPGSRQADPASTTVEDTVAEVWSQVLCDPQPAPEHDFMECGGHSLRAMRLVSALRHRLRRDVSVADVYAGRTLGGLTARLVAAPLVAEDAHVRTGNPPALSPAQRRMWFVERLAPDTPAHNISMAERLQGPLEASALREALRSVAQRHGTLRWRVPQRDGVPYVVVEDAYASDPLTVVDLSARGVEAAREQAMGEVLNAEAARPFDLATGPLWRATLVRLATEHHVLIFTAHHIVFDGWSQDVLYRDIARAYAAAAVGEPPQAAELPAEFGDYVAELTRRTLGNGRAHLDWWIERLRDAPTVCDLPRDRTRPPAQTFRGKACRADIGAETAAAVRALARRVGTTAHAVLLAVFGQLVRRLTGQHDVLVGIPYADRDDVAFEPLIGNLLQVLPVRLRVSDTSSFTDHVRRSSDAVTDAVAHRDAPLERIVEALRVPRDLTRNPLVQVLFNMYESGGARLRLPGCAGEHLPAGLPGSLFDLTLYVNEQAGGWRMQVVYNPDLYDADRVEAYLGSYLRLVRELTTAPE
ncbi:MAG: amino acid adenylation domain-containing protein, partial [Thermocrispum sp.]